MRYQLVDSLCVYTTKSGSFRILRARDGIVCTFHHSIAIQKILQMLQNPVSLDELCSSFPNVPRESIANLMRNLQQYQIVEAVSDDSVLPMNVAVLGLGSLGSHIVQQISMLGLCSPTLIDDDIVEYDNIYRQIYTLYIPSLMWAKRNPLYLPIVNRECRYGIQSNRK